VDALLADPARRTRDLGGPLGTRAFAEALCAEIKRKAESQSMGVEEGRSC
jgi:hypothetical protein